MSEPNGRLARDPWANVAKRLASKARGTVSGGRGNYAVLHVTIVVNDHGNPVGWTAPRGDRLEPRGPWLLETGLVKPIKDID